MLHFRQSREQPMHAGSEGAAAFAMNDADAQDAALAAFGEVFGQQAAEFIWTKGVQIEFRTDRVLHHIGDRFVGVCGHGGR